MLRKKEKKSIASIIALLIGWPVGLDQFVEGNIGKGIAIIFGWIITGLMFLGGVANYVANSGYYHSLWIGLLVMSFSATIVGGVLVTVKLVKLLRSFVAADD